VSRLVVRALAGAVLAAACGRDPRPDVLLVVLDTVRADHLSVYGYERPTSPALEALARDGVVYRNAFAAGTWTPPSHASLFTGLLPSSHRVGHASASGGVGEGIHALDPSVPTLAEGLRAVGYRTAAFVGNHGYLHPVFGLGRGFERYRWRNLDTAGRLAATVVPWLERRRGRSVFLFLNLIDAHEPYAPPPPYDRLFPGRLERPVPEHPQDVLTVTGRLPAADEMAHYVSQYDGEIRYVDDRLAEVFAVLRRQGRYDNALIIVTADHGELLGEHGRWGHGGDPIHPLVHVPLVVKYPGSRRVGVDERPVGLADVPATVLAVLGLPALGAGQVPLWERSGVAVAEAVGPDRVVRAAYDGAGHELVETIVSGRREVRVYDLRSDPAEARPLDPSADPTAPALDAALARLVAALPPPRPGPVVFPKADAFLARRLRALGYTQ
jgi:arylsulfatase A-like enzyme